jgi:hypothetical protein
MPKGIYDDSERDFTGFDAKHQEQIEEKRQLQQTFVNDLIQQWNETTKDNPNAWLGILGTCKKYDISVMTWSNWCKDNDFQPLLNQYKAVRANKLKDLLFSGLITGKQVNVTAFLLGVLNRLDDEFRDTGSRPITIQFSGGIRATDVRQGGKVKRQPAAE